MEETTKKNSIPSLSLIATTTAGVVGVVTGLPVIQAVAYLPPVVQFVFENKFNFSGNVDKELKEELRKIIFETCDTTQKQLQKKSNTIARFFEYACAGIESELTKEFSLQNIDVYFHKCIQRDAMWEGMNLTDKDLREIMDMFISLFVERLLDHQKLANYLYSLELLNHEQRIRSLETEVNNRPYELESLSEDFVCYDDTKNYCDKYEEVLFLHKKVNPENAILLKDVFTMPSCVLQNYQNGSVQNQKYNDTSLAIKSFLCDQPLEPGCDSGNILFIEGQAAMGKSSLVSWLAWQYYNQTNVAKDLLGDKTLRVIKLRDLLIEDTKLDVQTPFRNIYDYMLGKENHRILNNAHINVMSSCFKDTVWVLDGFDELCMVESIWESGKSVYFQNMFRQLNQSDCGCKVIVTTRPNYLKIDGLDFPKWYLQIDPFNLDKREKWVEKYSKKEKLSLELKTDLLSSQEKTVECLLETPLVLYMIAAKKVLIRDTNNIWELYHKIFSEEIYKRNYDRDGSHKIQKYHRHLYALTAEIANAISKEQHFFTTIERLLEIDQVKKLAKEMNLLEHDENVNYDKLHTVLADCIGIASYFKVSVKKDHSGIYKNAIEFYHNNIKDYFCCEYIWMNLQRIYQKILPDRFWMESWFLSNFQNMFQFTVYMKDNNQSNEPSMVSQFFKSKLLHYKQKDIKENFISQELSNRYFKYFFGKMLQTGMIYKYEYSGNKNILNMMANIYASVLSIYHSIYIIYLEGKELIEFTKEEYTVDISTSFIYRLLFLMGSIHNQSYLKYDGIMLSFISLEKHDFRFASFKGCLLIGCNFQGCDLRGTNFAYAKLQEADLRNTMMDSNTCFKNAEFEQTIISKKQLPYIGEHEEGALLVLDE